MAGYHCLMPNGIFPANPSPMSNGIVSLLTAPCMLPNGIFFLAGCLCLMLNGILPAILCPMPIGILFAGCPFVCCLLHLFVLMPLAFFLFNRALLMCGSMQPHSGIGGDEKKPFHGGGDRLLLSELYPCGKALIYLWNTFLSYLRHSV